ncbi:hypothetical protein [Haliscomenobacter hydrossis]|uniref:PKD domain containing protein n=1 Tax=Haliscomenobacter hydrossis (strain ATCC 27775 / DSM 1100 / LMG 10767 / O) TaxID=760192 RepID=F4L2C8_HALH1|nr:hypothetical protein [Haliscomenobacter hydrossis]AEE52881.1 PKD domain containing protein [Haliscomenobacter hydrossis DSM 1100]
MKKTTTRLLMLSLCLLLSQLLWSQNPGVKSNNGKPITISQALNTNKTGNKTVTLRASGGDKFRWNTGASTQAIEVPFDSRERYTVDVEEKDGRRTSLTTPLSPALFQRKLTKPGSAQLSAPDPQPGCPTSSLTGSYSRICAGTTLQLSANGGTSYLWSTGQTSSSIQVTPTMNINYTVTITFSDPEESLSCQDIKSTGLIEVIEQPAAVINGGGGNLCGGGVAVLTAGGGDTYLWNTGATSASISVSPASTSLYSVTATKAGLCTDDASTTVNVTPFNPSVSGLSTVCLGYGAQLSASGGTSYLWSNGFQSSSINVGPTSPGTYAYSVTITNGSCSAVRSHTLTVNPSPSASISGPAGACYNGSIALSASGGGTYFWSTGASTPGINVAALQSTQSFTVTVSNSYGCKRSESKTVTVYAPPSLDGTLSVCDGEAATLSVTGGSSYSWSTGESTASISPYPSSTSIYRVTVSDPNACTYVLSKTVSVSNLPNARISGPNTTCAGQNVSLTAFGGSSYLWSTGANTATINVSPGSTTTFTVTVSSGGGCLGSASQVINVRPLPIGNIAGASSVCPGQSTTLSASGGSTYLWNTGASSAAIEVSPTQNTNYTVSITNAEGCTVVKSHAVAVNISGSASNDGPLTCSKTTATLLGTSSAQGASYRWKNASGVEIATTPGTTVTTAGVYTLEITAAGGCKYTTATEVVQDLQIPQVSANSSGMLTCVQSSINLLGTSSASPASYEWRNGSGILIANTLNASTTQTGTYTLKVTAANGCSNTASTAVTEDLAVPVFTPSNDGPLTCTKTSVTLDAGATSTGLSYTWKNHGGSIISTSATVTVSAVGTYSVEVRGSNGCKTTRSTAVTLSADLPQVSANNGGPISCVSETSTLTGSSTTSGVSYQWYNPNNRLVSTQASFSTKVPGTYTFKVIAADGCSNSATTTVGTMGALPLAPSVFNNGPLSCTKGSVSMSASTLSNNVSYEWRNESGAMIGTSSGKSVTEPGAYTVRIQKSDGCAISLETVVQENRPQLQVNISGDAFVCWGGETTLTATGGGTYTWNTGESTPSVKTSFIYGPITYAVTVSTGTYCNASASFTVGNAPTPVANITGHNSVCNGSPLTLTASGGQTYKWSGTNETTQSIVVNPTVATTYTVTVTSDKGCTASKNHVISTVKSQPNNFTLSNVPTEPFCGEAPLNISVVNPNSNYTWSWSTGETTSSIQRTLTSSQTISVTATRNNGCTRTKAIPITVNPRPQGLILGVDISCAGGSTTLTAPLGETYLWSTGASTSSINIQPASDQTHNVTVSNAGGTCSAVFSKTVVVPAALSLNYTLANVEDCTANNASVQPIITGGQGNISLSIARYGELYFSPSLNGLRSGTYALKAEDDQQCIALKEVVIDEKQPAPAIDLPDVEVCAGATANLSINNAAAYTAFLWSNGATTSSITVSPTTITTYTITATASNGCQATDEVVVRVNPILTAIAQGSQTFCLPFGSSANANLYASVNGGTAPYTYQWYSGQTTASIGVSTPASAGFGVVVTDSKGCTASASTSIIVVPFPEVQITGGDIACYGNSTTLSATGGQSYLWSTGATTASIAVTPSSSTYYSVTVSNGICAAVPTGKMVLVPEALSLSHQLENDDDCIVHNAVIVPSATGGQGDKIFKIARNGELYFSETLIGLASGNYILVAEDSVGCTVSQEVEIKETPVGIDSLTLQGVDDCVPGNTKLIVETTGNHLPLVYRLNGQVVSGPTITLPTAAGDYTIEVEDAAGCKATRNEYYPAYDILTVNEYNISPVTDCSTPNGSIRLSLEGSSTSAYSSSVDGGTTWHPGDWVGNLRPGTYTTAVRYGSNGCVIQGPSVQVSAPNCLPEAGFTKDTIMVRSTTQRIVLPWKVESRPWGAADKDFSLIVKREGDGTPHFVDPNIATLQSPELRNSSNTLGQVVGYAPTFAGNDSLVLVLQPEAGDYLEPGIYIFTLEGENIEVDPFRNKLTVFVDLDGRLIVETFSVCGGDPIVLSVTDPKPGECYSWEGVEAGNVSKVTISNHIPGKVYKVWKLYDLKVTPQIFIGDDLANAKVPYKIDGPISKVCKGNDITIEAKKITTETEPGWTIAWDDTGLSGEKRTERAEITKTYKLWVTSPNGCRYAITHTVEVDDLSKVKITPSNPVACETGTTKLTIEGLPSSGYNIGWTTYKGVDQQGNPIARPASSGSSIQAGIGRWYATIGGGCAVPSIKTEEIEVKLAQGPNLANSVKAVGGFYFLPGIVTYGDQNNDLATYPPVPEMGSGGVVEVLGRERNIAVEITNYPGIEQIKAMAEAIVAQDSWINSIGNKKVFIVTPDAFCQNQDVLAKALIKIREYDLGYVVVPVSGGGGGVYIINTTFKQAAMSPVSDAHRSFVKSRIDCMVANGDATNGQEVLGVVFNTLIDNYETSYEELAEAFVGLDCSAFRDEDVFREDPELRSVDCKKITEPTKFFNTAALIITLPSGTTPVFNINPNITQAAQPGCVVSFTTGNKAIYTGRYYAPSVHPSYQTYHHVGFESQVKAYQNPKKYAFPTVDANVMLANVWYGKNLGDISYNNAGSYQIHVLDISTKKVSPGPTCEGDYVGSGLGKTYDLRGSKTNGVYFFKSTPALTSDDLSLWNVKLDAPFARRQVESSTDQNDPLSGGFIVSVPREGSAKPIILYIRYLKGASEPSSIHYFDEEQGCRWVPYDIDSDALISAQNKLKLRRMWQWFANIWDGGHLVLDIGGIFNPIGDIFNAAWYFHQGKPVDGAISLIGVAPLVGDVVVVFFRGRLRLLLKNGDEVITFLKQLKFGDEVIQIDMKKIFDGLLTAPGIPSTKLESLYRQLADPAFNGPDAAILLKAFEDDPAKMAKLWSEADELGTSLDDFTDFVKWAQEANVLQFVKDNPAAYAIYHRALLDGLPTNRIITLFNDFNTANGKELMYALINDPELIKIWALADEVGSDLKLDPAVLKRLKADLNPDLEAFIRARDKSGLAAWNILDGAKKCFTTP